MDLYHLRRIFLLMIFAIGTANSALAPMRPIFEATEEVIPLLGNPLGGGTPEIVKRNIKLHVSNQQKIFNRQMSERMKAQRQQMRSLEPQDSYLKAYHEQHEQFQIDLERKLMEQMVSNKKETKFNRPTKNATTVVNNKNDLRFINLNQINENKEIKIDKNLINPAQIFRNKRLDLEHYANRQTLEKSPRNIEFSPGYFLPMKRIHITPNAYMNPHTTNVQQESATITHYVPTHKFNVGDVSALTSAALKQNNNYNQNQYSQLNGYYQQNRDIGSSLSALIGKEPDDQLKGLSYLLEQSNSNHKVTNSDVKNTHINFKASSIDVPQEYYDKHEYKSPYTTPLNSYQQYIYGHETHDYYRDHTPITEPVDDAKETTKTPQRYTSLPTAHTHVEEKPTTSYYKVEVSSQVHHEDPKNDVSLNDPTPSYSYTSGHDNLHYASQYEFGYRVRDPHSGSDYGHREVSDGHSAAGSYHVLLPDGRLQKVKYCAGPDGFQAQVTYD